jgi:hydrogenase nickel incorporation protein HypA/HybF
MHEPAIAAELIELVQKEIAQAGYPNAPVKTVLVRIGALRGVVEDSLLLAFDVLKPNTPLCGASLTIEPSPIKGVCRSCGASFAPSEAIFICHQCGSGDLDVQQGDELDLISLTIEAE